MFVAGYTTNRWTEVGPPGREYNSGIVSLCPGVADVSNVKNASLVETHGRNFTKNVRAESSSLRPPMLVGWVHKYQRENRGSLGNRFKPKETVVHYRTKRGASSRLLSNF